ncbi:hypothetical protein CVS40_12971 [Lucilia cuprina]|nr:hypothetical protein CVS40_12971 [Lucilia cuprina]
MHVKPPIVRSQDNPFTPSEKIQPPDNFNSPDSIEEASLSNYSHIGSVCESEAALSAIGCQNPHLKTETDFADLERDIGISKTGADILASRLQQWGLVAKDFHVTSSRKRSRESIFDECFKLDTESGITYAVDIPNLFKIIGYPYDPDEWRLFIDGSVKSLKGVLLNIGNMRPSIPIIYATDVEENYENLKTIFRLINYITHRWRGFPKHQCFMCLWEGRQRELHYTDHEWESRTIYQVGQNSIEHMPLVPAEKIILPPLHIKLGLIRNFVHAIHSNTAAMLHIKNVFPKLSSSKIAAGVFNGPQLTKLLKCAQFPNLLTPDEKHAWNNLIANFLGNHKSENYKEIVRNLVESFGVIGVKMSLKIHFLDKHIEVFPLNLGDFSDEHGERFHQDITTVENRFKGKNTIHMLSQYCWTLCRDTEDQHKRHCRRINF